MTDETTDERPDPTPAQAAKIAAAGAEAITNSDDPAKAEADAAQAIEKKAEALGVKVTPEDAAMIAAATIKALEDRGAFAAPAETHQETTVERSTGEPSGEHESAEKEHHGGDDDHAADEAPPRKSSWAARYLGKKGGD